MLDQTTPTGRQVEIMIDFQQNTVGPKFFRLNTFYSNHDLS